MNMNVNYNDIKAFTRPHYDGRFPMSIHDRAAQFAPFAALSGFDHIIAETARVVDSKIELSEDEVNKLNADLNRLYDILSEQPQIRLTYYIPDKRKAGGRYTDKVGVVRIFDFYKRCLVFTDGKCIAIDNLYKIEFI